VTPTVLGLFDAPEELTVTLLVYVPAASPLGLTDTLKLPGVFPLEGVTNNQAADAVAV
jgi:hypothetical protein